MEEGREGKEEKGREERRMERREVQRFNSEQKSYVSAIK